MADRKRTERERGNLKEVFAMNNMNKATIQLTVLHYKNMPFNGVTWGEWLKAEKARIKRDRGRVAQIRTRHGGNFWALFVNPVKDCNCAICSRAKKGGEDGSRDNGREECKDRP